MYRFIRNAKKMSVNSNVYDNFSFCFIQFETTLEKIRITKISRSLRYIYIYHIITFAHVYGTAMGLLLVVVREKTYLSKSNRSRKT